jgi:tripeptide aminopeptidase
LDEGTHTVSFGIPEGPDVVVGDSFARFRYGIERDLGPRGGSTVGEVESETFSADAVVIKIRGINVHPGYAKGKMVNSLKVAGRFLDNLPKDTLSPETTEGREGYVHPTTVQGNEEVTEIKFIIRDFVTANLKKYEDQLKDILDKTVAEFPGAKSEFEVIEQYRNMKEILDQHPQVEKFAVDALDELKIKPINSAIRGGTDGSRLSFMGLPTPNLFAGGHNFHANTEYVAIQDMESAVKLIVTLSRIWEEKS